MAIPAQAPMPGDEATSTPAEAPHRSSTGLFLAALVARTWLWFVAGCLLVTLLPMVIGWRPFVVESGSMQPRIDVGDIVLAAPESDPENLLGRVTVFDNPDLPGSTKTHRVIALNDDGTMTTKGDANPNADTATLRIGDEYPKRIVLSRRVPSIDIDIELVDRCVGGEELADRHRSLDHEAARLQTRLTASRETP